MPAANQVAILVHIVTFNHAKVIAHCLSALLKSELQTVGLHIMVTDNASSDGTCDLLNDQFGNLLGWRSNSQNLGFCGAHNQGVADFLAGEYEYLLLVNPDLALHPLAIERLVNRFRLAVQHGDQNVGAVGPLLFRADDRLNPLEPRIYDSAGMQMLRKLRHIDRLSSKFAGQFHESCEVFGLSGACVMLSRACVEDVLLPRVRHEQALFELYPQLKDGAQIRPQLFDEAFFAYREDADLAWRMQIAGWRSWCETEAHGYHVRHVLPDRRQSLEAELNKLGVRNRFLLQLHNFPVHFEFNWTYWECWFQGMFLRNLIVIAAVYLNEESSKPAFKEVWRLLPRAYEQRRAIFSKRKISFAEIWKWFY